MIFFFKNYVLTDHTNCDLHEMSRPIFWKKVRKRIFQAVVCWNVYPAWRALMRVCVTLFALLVSTALNSNKIKQWNKLFSSNYNLCICTNTPFLSFQTGFLKFSFEMIISLDSDEYIVVWCLEWNFPSFINTRTENRSKVSCHFLLYIVFIVHGYRFWDPGHFHCTLYLLSTTYIRNKMRFRITLCCV